MSSSSKQAIIKILCLYLGTTAVFLAVLFWMLYLNETRHLILQQLSNLREKSIEIFEILQAHKDDQETAHKLLREEIETPIVIFNKKGQVIFNSLPSELTSEEKREGFAKRGDKVIIEPSMHDPVHRREPRFPPPPPPQEKPNITESMQFYMPLDSNLNSNKTTNETTFQTTQPHSNETPNTLQQNEAIIKQSLEQLQRQEKMLKDELKRIQGLKAMSKEISNHNRYREMRYKIFIEDDALDDKILLVRLKVITYFLLSFGIAGIVAYLLVRLSLKPLQEKIDTLNAFIKDSTHEINTPLSIILMSIETLTNNNFTQTQRQKIERIRLASKSLSHLYKDLVAYNFPHSISNKDEQLALHKLLKERLEYFAPFFEQKSLNIKTDITTSKIFASSEKITCVIDNLLSNAIKYNKKGGNIEIILRSGYLSIVDSGCGIKSEEMVRIFDRYVRCNEFQGGFGIGLTLIKRICNEYNIHINVKSEIGKGSAFVLSWEA